MTKLKGSTSYQPNMGTYEISFDRLELNEEQFSSFMTAINNDYILPFKETAPLMPLSERLLYYMAYQISLERSGKRQTFKMTGHPVSIISTTYFLCHFSSIPILSSYLPYVNDSCVFLAILKLSLEFGRDLAHATYSPI